MEKEITEAHELMNNQINPLFHYILERVHDENRNFIWVFCGETGSGKSMAALSSAFDLQPSFDIDKQVVFTASEFINLINRNPPLPPGSVILWDEAGVGLNNRAWFSAMNKIINDILQTYRHRNYITIFTVPLARFVDSKSRSLFHALTKMEKIDRTKSESIGKFFFEKVDHVTGQTWHQYPRFIIDGRVRKIKYVNFKMPMRKQVERYEAKKNAFTSNLNRNAGIEIEKITNPKPKKSQKLDYKELSNEVLRDLPRFMGYDGKVTTGKIKSELNIGQRSAADVRRMVLDKLNLKNELKRLGGKNGI